MDEQKPDLANCFLAVFPELNLGEVTNASSANLRNWDSVVGVALVRFEGEFDMNIDSNNLSRFRSFDGILQYLREGGNGYTGAR